MNKKIVVITALIIILYTFFLFCFGLFGEQMQQYSLHIGKYVLKYGFVAFGFVLAAYMPNRIYKALKQREDERYKRESEARITQAVENEKKAQEKIINEYIKNEDAI